MQCNPKANQHLGAATLDELQQRLQRAALEGSQRSGAVALGGCVQRPGSSCSDGHVRPRAQQPYYLHAGQRSELCMLSLAPDLKHVHTSSQTLSGIETASCCFNSQAHDPRNRPLVRTSLSGSSIATMAHLCKAIMLQQLLLARRVPHADLHERPDRGRRARADRAAVQHLHQRGDRLLLQNAGLHAALAL